MKIVDLCTRACEKHFTNPNGNVKSLINSSLCYMPNQNLVVFDGSFDRVIFFLTYICPILTCDNIIYFVTLVKAQNILVEATSHHMLPNIHARNKNIESNST